MTPAITEPGRPSIRVEIAENQDIVLVRQRAREQAHRAGFSLLETTKLVTVASELARNTLEHGGGGHAELEICTDGIRRGVRMRFIDEGPGIADVELALRDGFSTGKGLGLGLGGARRLVSEFEIETVPGRGTKVTVVRWK
ncbi:MAG TPA: anti-sigma regulatory factor [Kofleriaceae bacterium]|jgi:serine/threonine-protein kinase RsbT|nr:anti-sigma regulatory factor [Kofleriaceae bacterium]